MYISGTKILGVCLIPFLRVFVLPGGYPTHRPTIGIKAQNQAFRMILHSVIMKILPRDKKGRRYQDNFRGGCISQAGVADSTVSGTKHVSRVTFASTV